MFKIAIDWEYAGEAILFIAAPSAQAAKSKIVGLFDIYGDDFEIAAIHSVSRVAALPAGAVLSSF